MSKLVLLGVGAAGYVLGAKAGRERYEQIVRAAQRVRNDPKVQQKATDATEFAKDKAPDLKDQAAGIARNVAEKVGPNGARQSASQER